MAEERKSYRDLFRRGDTYARYSLVNVDKEHDGLVDGVWLQDFMGSFHDAVRAARDTEKANSNRIIVAVVEGLSHAAPDYSPQRGLKRLDLMD